jgi:hypothetical protein
MTSESRKRIDELLAAALRIDPTNRAAWLRGACRYDEGLRTEVARLLDQDARVAREGYPTASEPPGWAMDQTGSRPSLGGSRHRVRRAPTAFNGAAFGTRASGFSPRPAIASGPEPHPMSEAESVVRARLRELPMIYILILSMATFWLIFNTIM